MSISRSTLAAAAGALCLASVGHAHATPARTGAAFDATRIVPGLTRVAGDGAISRDHAAMPMAADQAAAIGELEITGAFARATLPNQPVGGGFLTIENTGGSDDRLVSASSDLGARTEIHEMAMDGDVMRMRPLGDGLPIPSGETVALEPGGYHLMFMDLSGPLQEGGTVSVTLHFEKAGDLTVEMPVRARDVEGPVHHGMDHGADR